MALDMLISYMDYEYAQAGLPISTLNLCPISRNKKKFRLISGRWPTPGSHGEQEISLGVSNESGSAALALESYYIQVHFDISTSLVKRSLCISTIPWKRAWGVQVKLHAAAASAGGKWSVWRFGKFTIGKTGVDNQSRASCLRSRICLNVVEKSKIPALAGNRTSIM
jgi:hypothetical protein